MGIVEITNWTYRYKTGVMEITCTHVVSKPLYLWELLLTYVALWKERVVYCWLGADHARRWPARANTVKRLQFLFHLQVINFVLQYSIILCTEIGWAYTRYFDSQVEFLLSLSYPPSYSLTHKLMFVTQHPVWYVDSEIALFLLVYCFTWMQHSHFSQKQPTIVKHKHVYEVKVTPCMTRAGLR